MVNSKDPGVIKLILLMAMSFVVCTNLVFGSLTAGQTRTQMRRSQKKNQSVKNPRIDYAQFSHGTHVTQQKLACDSCHKFPTKNWNEVRKGEAAFADVAEFPEHSSCLECHRTQFFARERPAPAICSNCHVKVTPRDTARYLFPSLGDIENASQRKRGVASDFGIYFPHDKHLDAVGLNTVPAPPKRFGFVTVVWQQEPAAKESPEPKSCPVCHQTYQPQGKSDEEFLTKPPADIGDNFWLKKGTFKSIPNSHAVCFTCHNTDVGIEPAPSDCNACHKVVETTLALKSDFDPKLVQTMGVTDATVLALWPKRISSGTYRHEGGEHPNLSCLGCHDVPKMNTLDKKSLVVQTKSCGGAEGCHVTASADDGGILNYEIDEKKKNPAFVCTKCHVSFGKESVPASHVSAINALKKP